MGGSGTAARAPWVLGADVCRGRWVGVVLGGGRATAHVAGTVAELVGAVLADAAPGAGRLDAVGLDIPIGLPDAGPRDADLLARQRVGRRAASVFPTPVRRALHEADHGAATALHRSLGLPGISRQAHGLRAKVLEVDAWARGSGLDVVEVHPELSFATLAGAPLAHPKKTWAGAQQRRALLAADGVVLPDDLGAAGAVAAVDDVLDAAAAAWTARRRALGLAVSHPDPPQRFSDGWPAAIWA